MLNVECCASKFVSILFGWTVSTLANLALNFAIHHVHFSDCFSAKRGTMVFSCTGFRRELLGISSTSFFMARNSSCHPNNNNNVRAQSTKGSRSFTLQSLYFRYTTDSQFCFYCLNMKVFVLCFVTEYTACVVKLQFFVSADFVRCSVR